MAQSKKQTAKQKSPRIRVDDEVIVISGEGRIGKTPRKVIQVLPREGKVIVEGVRIVKDTQKNRQQESNANPQDFIEKPQPIDISNVALIDPQTKKPTRVRMKAQDNGRKLRVAARSGEEL